MGQHEKLQQVEEYNQLLEAVLMSLCEELETTPEALLESTLEEGILRKIGKGIRRSFWQVKDSLGRRGLKTATERAIQKRKGLGHNEKAPYDDLAYKEEKGYGSNRKTLERQKENRKLAQQQRAETRSIKIEKQKRAEKKAKLQTAARERMAREQPKNLEYQKKMAKRKQERAHKAAEAARRRRESSDRDDDWGYSSSSDSSYSPTSGTM